MQPLAAAAAYSAYMLCFVLLACKDTEVLNTEDVAWIVSWCSPQVSLFVAVAFFGLQSDAKHQLDHGGQQHRVSRMHDVI